MMMILTTKMMMMIVMTKTMVIIIIIIITIIIIVTGIQPHTLITSIEAYTTETTATGSSTSQQNKASKKECWSILLIYAKMGSSNFCLLNSDSIRQKRAVKTRLVTRRRNRRRRKLLCLFVGCLTSQQHASVSQGRICKDNFTCRHTEIEVADQTFYLTQSQYTDTGPTSPSTDPITPGAWQGSHRSANFQVTGMTRPRKNPGASGI